VTSVLAHGVGSVQDLPVPRWLFLYGAGAVLVASFVALGVLWRRPVLERYDDGGRALPDIAQRFLLSRALRVVLGAVSLALLVLVGLAALLGTTSAGSNLAPTFVYVVFWLGLVPVVVVLGNVWAALNPWRAAADGVAWISARVGLGSDPFSYPERLGRWPAAVLLLLFAALELAWYDPADPRVLGVAILVYSAITWFGAVLFGREAWFANGEAFSVYFWLLSRLAPFDAQEVGGRRRIVVRPPLVGLASLRDPRPGTVAFVAVMLGSVGFDGFSRTSWWTDRRAPMEEVAGSAFSLAGLVLAVLVVASAYLVAVGVGRLLARTDLDLTGAFVASLVPIALVYAVSHYFSLLVVQGQFAVPLASDPFGWGWDVFGTADFRPSLAPITPTAVWYVQVATLVGGHILGLVLAHDRALALFEPVARALRTQYPVLVLMVAYTVGGLWLLSQD
jgi:hypothetical protein